jgi:hypothetical protein
VYVPKNGVLLRHDRLGLIDNLKTEFTHLGSIPEASAAAYGIPG